MASSTDFLSSSFHAPSSTAAPANLLTAGRPSSRRPQVGRPDQVGSRSIEDRPEGVAWRRPEPAGTPPALDSGGSTFHPSRWALRAHAARLLRPEGEGRGPAVCGCGTPGKDTLGFERAAVSVGRRLSGELLVEGDLRCDSPWACPVCAPARSMLAQEKVAALASAAQAAGSWMVFATYTLRHSRTAKLSDLLEVLNGSYRKSQQGKGFTRLADVYAYIGGTKAIEVRWSPRYGWHPHLHVVHFFNSREGDALAGTRALVERYREQVAKLGGYASPAAQDVRSCYDPEGAGKYSTKGACELTNSGAKSYDAARNKSLSPFDLLKFSADLKVPKKTRELYSDLFREFTRAMAGKPLCRVSSKLTKEYGLAEVEREPLNPDDVAEGRVYVSAVVVRDAVAVGLWAPLLDRLSELSDWHVDAAKVLVLQLICRLGRKEDPELLTWGSAISHPCPVGLLGAENTYKSRHFVH